MLEAKDEKSLIIQTFLDRGVYEYRNAFEMIRNLEEEGSEVVDGHRVYDKDNFALAHEFNKTLRWLCADSIRRKRPNAGEVVEVYRRALLFDAPYDFDSYCMYIEWDREPRKRFYEPRRFALKPLVDKLQDLEDDKLDLLAISLPPGVGKALANDTPIMTRNGWKNHGDLVVGDEVVGMDGKYKKVIAVHPKCMLDREVEFSNGAKIVCHENHEWLIHDRGRHQDHDYIAETKRLEKRKYESGGERGKRGHRYILQLPKRGVMEGTHTNLPIDPYLFGVWLGDGSNNNPRICNAKKDHAIVQKILSKGYPIRWQTEHKTTHTMYYDFDIRSQLRLFDMCHSRQRKPKYIPSEYLTADVSQRLELLAGLIDTDGCLCGEHKYQFSTCEESLRDSFRDLISTFGWRLSIGEYGARVSTSGVIGRSKTYVMSFSPDLYIPCALERKQIKSFAKQRAIGIKQISRVAPVEGNCITVEGDGMYLAGKEMLPTHNTTLAIFYLSWISGRHPELQNIVSSHNTEFLKGVYGECMRIFDRDGEYLYKDVFPEVEVCGNNAKDVKIDLGTPKRFTTLEFSSIGSGNAGKIRATKLLYCDDLVSGIEEAMSKDRLDKLYQQYVTDLRQRKQGDVVKELHIATRWSIHDVISRLEIQYENNPRACFINIPALNEDDESNFDYAYGVGFSTEFYHEQREIMDSASWEALYMGHPIEREGTLYPPEEFRRYFDLPERDPDSIVAVLDIADGGGDYWAMPIAFQYGGDYYIVDWICDNNKPDVVEERIIKKLMKYNVQLLQCESNRAGGRVAENIEKRLKEMGQITRVTTKWNQTQKATRILVASGYVKQHFLFKDDSLYRRGDKEYRTAMQQLCGYSMIGKNAHDDVPDSLSMLVDFISSFTVGHAQIIRRPF